MKRGSNKVAQDSAAASASKRSKRAKENEPTKAYVDQSEATKESPRARAKSTKIAKVTVDELCPIRSDSDVFVDEDDIAFDASLNLSNIDGNNNKFYYLQLLLCQSQDPSYAIWTHWGRVGENGQSKLVQGLAFEAAKTLFDKKFKEKTGLAWEKRKDPAKVKKYAMIEKSYADETHDEADKDIVLPDGKIENHDLPDCSLSQELQDLVSFLFNTDNMKAAMTSQKYNFKKLPLGKLSKGTLAQGYLALKELGDVFLDPESAVCKYKQSLAAIYNDLSSKYYTVIPHDFGRNRPTPISSEAQLRVEMDLVETLGNMQISNKVLNETEYPQDRNGIALHPYDARMESLG